MRRLFLLLSILTCCAFTQINETNHDLCGMKNTSFKAGESFSLTIFYSVAGLYVNAGTANISTTLGHFDNRTVYRISCDGRSNSSYDWVFKVRDHYESYVDTATMQSLKFIRQIHEGKYKKRENVVFNRETNTAITNKGVYKTPDCIQDVVSAVFNARNIDFNKYRPGDKIPFKMFLDNEVYSLYIRYLGKERITTRFGTFNAIKFKPLLIQGEMFKGGEKMTVWVSDDANHLPLRIESPIVVGAVKVDMTGYKNLRYPLSSRIN